MEVAGRDDPAGAHPLSLLCEHTVIMSDAAVEQRRALIKRKKKEKTEVPAPGGQGLTEEQQALIQELMEAQMKTFDTTFSHFKDFRVGGLEL